MRRSITLLTMAVLTASAPSLADVINIPDDYPTIQEGINAANSGDIVLVAEGEYLEEITLKSGVIVQGAGEGLSVINGGGDSGDVVRALGNDIDEDTKLMGFTITGAISGGSMPGGGGVFCNSGAAPEIANNRIEGNDTGIATWNNSAAFVHNNVVINNNYTAVSLSSPSAVINNTIAHNNIGIYDSGGYRPTIMNNIVVSNTSIGIGCVNASVPTDISYNDVWNNGSDYHNCNPGTGDISEDPLFVDEPGGDYHLGDGSPCIDAGNPDSEHNDPDGSRNDMGAYGGPGAEADIPEVSLTFPSQNELSVAAERDVSAIFSVDMDPSTLTSLTCMVLGRFTGPRYTSVTYDAGAKMVTMDLATDLLWGEPVTALLTTGIESEGGTALRGFAWQFTAEVAGGSGQYGSAAPYACGTTPNGLTVGDFNADGNLDVVVANILNDAISVLLGLGDGSFAAPTSYPGGAGAAFPCTADLNSDCTLDLAVANTGSNDVSVFPGMGDGTFASATNYPVGNDPTEVCTGDFNFDGALDLATANSNSDNISILLSTGSGSFGLPMNYTTGHSPQSICAGDVNADGRLDLVVTNELDDDIRVFLGQGDGTFATGPDSWAGDTPVCIRLGDFNGDGTLDAAVVNAVPGNLTILKGNGNGTFSVRQLNGVGVQPSKVCIGDLNADGYLDLAVTNRSTNNIAVLRGRGDGTFDTPTHVPCLANPRGIAAADFDNDGDLDLCNANHDDHMITFLANNDALAVTALDPEHCALHVPLGSDISSSFNIALNETTLDNTTFLLRGRQSGAHTGTISYDGGTYTATLNPTADLYDGEIVTASLTTGIQAANGVGFRGFSWSFTAAVTSPSSGEFEGPEFFFSGSEPRGVYASDYDADGDTDIAVTSSNYPQPGSIAILMNQGDGSFAAPVSYSLGAPDPIAVFAADLDGDEDTDLAVSHNEPGTSHLVILKNDGDGTFTLFGTYAPATLGQDVGGGDLDADGDVDLIMTDGWGSSNNVKVLFNEGSGTFGSTQTLSAGTYAREVLVEDVDNDGDLDIAVASSGDGNLTILPNDGYGNFPTLVNYTLGQNVRALFANDFNADGHVDFAGGGSDAVAVILNNGDGSFGAPASYPTGSSVRSLGSGDLDGDGMPDLAASLSDALTVWVALNNGDGTYGDAIQYDVGDYPWGIQVADFDLDGALDLCAAIFRTNGVELLYNTGPSGIEELTDLFVNRGELVAFPNPFRGNTKLAYRWGSGQTGDDLTVRIYDLSGRQVRSLLLTERESGLGSVVWDARDARGRRIANGVYFCKLTDGGRTASRRVLLVE